MLDLFRRSVQGKIAHADVEEWMLRTKKKSDEGTMSKSCTYLKEEYSIVVSLLG